MRLLARIDEEVPRGCRPSVRAHWKRAGPRPRRWSSKCRARRASSPPPGCPRRSARPAGCSGAKQSGSVSAWASTVTSNEGNAWRVLQDRVHGGAQPLALVGADDLDVTSHGGGRREGRASEKKRPAAPCGTADLRGSCGLWDGSMPGRGSHDCGLCEKNHRAASRPDGLQTRLPGPHAPADGLAASFPEKPDHLAASLLPKWSSAVTASCVGRKRSARAASRTGALLPLQGKLQPARSRHGPAKGTFLEPVEYLSIR